MKVTVIVPTYRTSPEGLERLVTSLDRQTLPQDDFEVLFVDDGSPDDTVDRLRQVASSRPNYQVFACENSGWPSRPRNFGLDHAGGEYVAFIDHDDEFFPDALRAAHQFAVENSSDVVNGKEAYTNNPDWALSTYTADQPQSRGRADTHPLLPMNPHKLYRRGLLVDNDIRFVEERRALWEDVFFNLQVARHATVISTLSSVPYYHWVETKGGGSDTAFAKWTDDYWFWYRRILTAIMQETEGDEHAEERLQLLRTQYVNRVLGAFDGSFSKRPDEACTYLFHQAGSLRDEFALAQFDVSLSPSQRARAHLLAHGDPQLMKRLCSEDRPLKAIANATEFSWNDGQLSVTANVVWAADDDTWILRQSGDRIIREFSADLNAIIPESMRDVTQHVLSAPVRVSVRHRSSRIAWLQPSTSDVHLVHDVDDRVRFEATVAGTIPVASAAMGHPLEDGHWDLFVSSRLHPRPASIKSSLPATATFDSSRLHLVYSNDGGGTTLYAGGQRETPRRLAPLEARVVSPTGEAEIDLAGRHDGAGEIDTTVEVRVHTEKTFRKLPAVLAVHEGRASLRFMPPGPQLSVRVGDRTGERTALQFGIAGGQVITGSGGIAQLKAHASFAQNASPLVSADSLQRFADVREGHTDLRILLLTNNDSDNVGDQLIEASAISILQGVMQNLGLPAERLVVDSRAAGIIPLKYLATKDPALLKTARAAIAGADIVVFGGAPLFNYRYQPFYARTIRTVELAQEYGVPVIFSSIGVEPFDAGDEKSMALKAALQLPVVQQITTRDDLASVQQYVAETGIPVAHVADPAVLADLVFEKHMTAPTPRPEIVSRSLRSRVPYPIKTAIRRAQGRPAPRHRPNGKVVGLVVTRAGIFKDNGIAFSRKKQADFWMSVIAELQHRGYDYRLFTTGHFADEAFLNELVGTRHLPQDKVTATVNSPEELIDQLRACDGVIAYRLHASIAAFALDVPCIGLSWNFKVRYFYESVGYGDRALGHERWTAAEVVPALEKAMRDGVHKDGQFLWTVYSSLFTGLKSVFAPECDQRPWTYEELRTHLPTYPGTSPDQYRDKAERKLRRMYEAYRRYVYN